MNTLLQNASALLLGVGEGGAPSRHGDNSAACAKLRQRLRLPRPGYAAARMSVKAMRLFTVSLVTVILVVTSGISAAQEPVVIAIDRNVTHQTMFGFGATTTASMSGFTDYLSTTQRQEAVRQVYAEIKLTTGNLEGALLESPGDYSQRRNDNSDPFNLNSSGFQTTWADYLKTKILDLAQPLGFNDFFLAQKVNVRWASPWLDTIRSTNFNLYLDEVAEQVEAGHLYWRNQYGIQPELQMPFNEPLSGNRELLNGTTNDLVAIVKRVGARLQTNGFNVRFVLPNEETEEKSLSSAQAVLADPVARPYVAVIGYHTYPYGSVYADISRILSTSGAGRPDSERIAVRRQLRDLGRQHNLPLWMTEVSNGGVSALSYDDFRGRAIHIHDELVYADAAAYFGMNAMWDTRSAIDHGLSSSVDAHEGTLVMVDTAGHGRVYITGIGYAIGHYARWIRKGARRIDATSPDPLVQVTAFDDVVRGRLAVVLINNASAAKQLRLTFQGYSLAGQVEGEQSTTNAYWQALPPFAPTDRGEVEIQVPALSVTSLGLGRAVPSKLKLERGAAGRFRLLLEGEAPRIYELLASTNLLNWSPWATLASTNSMMESWFTNDPSIRSWFYRAREVRN